MKYFGAIKLAIVIALLTLLLTNMGLTFWYSTFTALGIMLIYFVVTRVKIIRVNQPISSNITFGDLISLKLPRYFWHGLEGQFYTVTLDEGEAILNRMKDIDRDSWIATDLFEGMDEK